MTNSFALAAAAVIILATSSVAEAKIECRDGFQIVNGQEISTPYCNDGLIAKVARERGMNVSEDNVRNSPSTKNEVCRFVGDDIRVQNYCDDTDQGRDEGK
jgi:hypothetical protein